MSNTVAMASKIKQLEHMIDQQATVIARLEQWRKEADYKLEQLSDRNAALLRRQSTVEKKPVNAFAMPRRGAAAMMSNKD